MALPGRSVWLSAILVMICLGSYLRFLPTYPAAETQNPSPPSADQHIEPATSAKSDLEKEPLRIYVPSPSASPDVFSKWSEPQEKEGPSEKPPSEKLASKEPPLNDKEDSHNGPLVGTFEMGGSDKRIDRPLVTYVYSESEFGRVNLEFFVQHGLHDAADFVFILNGETDAEHNIIPDGRENIKVIRRNNTCYDLGAHAEVLSTSYDDKPALKDRYKRFILMNASIRGPFMPSWSKECWSDAYLSRLNDKVKLVGSTLNCHKGDRPHVQSMIWATDEVGLSHMLEEGGINECYSTLQNAMEGEINMTPYLRSKGYQVDVMMSVYKSEGDYSYIDKHCTESDDWLYQNAYFGFSVHPYEVIFQKSHRGIQDNLLNKLTEWQGKSGYSSYNVCKL